MNRAVERRCRRIRPVPASLLLLALMAASTSAALATKVRRLNLEELTERAGRIVVGSCESVRVAVRPGVGPVTRITFRVERSLKGDDARTLTVQMPGGAVPERGRLHVAGLPRFREGEKVILFLYPESEAGFTSPVGLGQGKFVVVRDKTGREIARNAFRNRGLVRRLSPGAGRRLRSLAAAVAADPAAVEPSTLVRMIEELLPARTRGRKAGGRRGRP